MSDRRTESTLVKDLKNFSRACHPERSEAPAECSEGPLHFLDSTLGVACPGPNVRDGVSLPEHLREGASRPSWPGQIVPEMGSTTKYFRSTRPFPQAVFHVEHS